MTETKTCIYCKSRVGDDPDHVPPKTLFPRPRPSSLVTVPCCKQCNTGFQKDDDYFRRMVLMRQDVIGSPTGSKMLPSLYREIERRESIGLSKAIFKTIREVEVRSPGGIILGKAPVYEADNQRLSRTIQRIAYAFIYHVNRETLPAGYKIFVHATIEKDHNYFEMVAPVLNGRPWSHIGDEVFSYTHAAVPEDRFTSIWLFVFYNRVPYLAMSRANQAL